MPIDQDAVLEPDEFEAPRTPTQTELDRGEPPADPDVVDDAVDALDALASDELREGETDDPEVAAEEGLTYVPPVDPAFRASLEGPESDVSPDELDLTTQIHDALRADSVTIDYADRLVIVTRGSSAIVRGTVDDITDSDTIVAVIEGVDGITSVVDETELADG
jgi:hypothetical protein